MKKNAFTLAEIVIMLIIMGILSAILLQDTNPFLPKYKSLYYYLHKNVKKFTGELIAESSNKQLSSNDVNFCSDLLNNLNAVGGQESCNAFYTGTIYDPYNGLTASTIDTPSFTLTNGQRFYLSTRLEDPISGGYRILAADLNGKSKPNETDKDIVPFALKDDGTIIPLGEPINNKEYLSAIVKVYNGESGVTTGQTVMSGSDEVLTYKQALCLSGNPVEPLNGYCSPITIDSKCDRTIGSTFCRMTIQKPLLKVKI